VSTIPSIDHTGGHQRERRLEQVKTKRKINKEGPSCDEVEKGKLRHEMR
jgi:hypothetical protein